MMMKTSSTQLVFLFLLFTSCLFAQPNTLYFKAQLMPGGGTWGVYVKTDPSISPSSTTITGSAQVTIVVPSGFQINNLVSVAGLWTNNALVQNPVENPGYSYISFGLVNDNPPINYQNGEQLLFKFSAQNQSVCPDTLHLIQNGVDPFDQLPNSSNTNPGNEITVIDFGAGATIYNYGGNYALSAWNCHDCDGDGIANAFEDTNGDGEWTPGVDVSPLCGEGGGGCTNPEFATHPANATTCSGVSLTLSAVANNATNASFQWQMSTDGSNIWADVVNNSNFDGVQTTDLKIANTAGMNNYRFRLKAANDTCEEISNPATLTVQGPITISGQIPHQTVCSGNATSFTVQANAGMAGTLSYQWQTTQNGGQTWTNIIASTGGGIYTNFTSKTLNISNVAGLSSNCYRVKLTTSECDAFYSQDACLDVLGPVNFTAQPASVTTCASSEATFQAAVENQSEDDSEIFYQWQVSTDQGDTWADLTNDAETSGAKTDKLTISNLAGKDGNLYLLLARAGDCEPVISQPAILKIGESLAFTAQPQSGEFCPAGQACFSVALSSQPSGYQWQIKSPGQAQWQDLSNNFIFSGAKSAQLCINNPLALAGISVRAKITSDCGELTSDEALLEINDDLKIVDEPENLTICHGEAAHFEAKLERECSYTGVTFAWEATTDGDNFDEIANSSDDAYIMDLLVSDKKIILGVPADETANGMGFRLKITTPTQTIYTETARLTVEGPVVFTQQPESLAACAGSDAAILANAIAENGQGDVTYQWEMTADGQTWEDISDDDVFSETTSNTLKIKNVSDTDYRSFRCKARTGACDWVVSDAAILTVEGPISFNQQPANTTVCHGSEAIFSVETTNQSGEGTLTYQWEMSQNGQTWEAVPSNTTFSGAGSNTLVVNAVTSLSGHSFRCKARTGACDWVVSDAAVLKTERISVALQPVSVTTCPDDGHVFKASISASYPNGLSLSSLQWQLSKDGGATWTNISENQPTGFGGKYTGVNTSDLNISLTDSLGGYRYRLVGATSVCEMATAASVLNTNDDLCPDPIGYECLGMKLKWLPDQQRWAVFIKPDGFAPPVYNRASSGRVTVVAPVGFTYTGLSSKAGGTWKPGIVMFNPPEAPGMQFMTFNLTPNNNQLLLTENEEIMLFSFAKVGDCPSNIYLMDEYVPQPFQPNELTGFALGLGFEPDMNFHLCSIYDREAAKCNPGHAMGAVQGPIGGNAAPVEAVDWFRMSPNPARDWLDVTFKDDWTHAKATLRVLNLKGQVVHKEPNVTGGYLQLNLRHLIPGQYFVVLESEGKVLHQEKLVKH
jgi:hypothetical protein